MSSLSWTSLSTASTKRESSISPYQACKASEERQEEGERKIQTKEKWNYTLLSPHYALSSPDHPISLARPSMYPLSWEEVDTQFAFVSVSLQRDRRELQSEREETQPAPLQM
nr:uncharacterized protein LOC111967254 isoform X3 [Salvelinus alpinus]